MQIQFGSLSFSGKLKSNSDSKLPSSRGKLDKVKRTVRHFLNEIRVNIVDGESIHQNGGGNLH